MPREALELFYVLLFCGCSKKSDKKVGAGADGNRGCNFKGLGSPVESTSTMNCSSQKAMHLHRLFHTSLTDLLAFFTYYKADADLLFAQMKVLKCCLQHSPMGVAATETPQQSAAQNSHLQVSKNIAA